MPVCRSLNAGDVLSLLEEKGQVRREADERDARGVRLYPPLSQEKTGGGCSRPGHGNSGTIDDPEAVATVNAPLRLIEERLTARGRGR